MADDSNVVEIRPGVMSEEDHEHYLNHTGTMVGLALLAQSYEREATDGTRVPEDVRLRCMLYRHFAHCSKETRSSRLNYSTQ